MDAKNAAARRHKILVVDDNEVIVNTLSSHLKHAGFDVIAAYDGAQAVSIVRKESPDLILLDITFPPDIQGVPWDGFRVMEWLHRVDEAKRIPVIIITGGEEASDKEMALSGGAVAFFKKPIDDKDLIRVIRSTLNTAPRAD